MGPELSFPLGTFKFSRPTGNFESPWRCKPVASQWFAGGAAARDTMSSAPQDVMLSAFENLAACDSVAAAAACKVPFLALSAERVLSDLARLRALCPHVITGQTVGAGHFQQLEVPEQINAMIERFLAVALPV